MRLMALGTLSFAVLLLLGGCGSGSSLPSANTPDQGPSSDSGDVEAGPVGDKELKTVDIYFAAGGDQGEAGGCYFASEVDSSAKTCSIYRLSWGVKAGALSSQEVVVADSVEGQGVWQPSVSADGKTIAFSHTGTKGVSLYRRSLDNATAGELGTEVNVQPQKPNISVWPNWSADGHLSFDRPNDSTRCVSPQGECVGPLERWSDAYRIDPFDAVSGQEIAIGGHLGFSFSDTSHHPTLANIIAGHGWYADELLAEFPSCDAANLAASTTCKSIRQTPGLFILDLVTDRYWRIEVKTAEAQYAENGENLTLVGCAHASWSPDGTKLLCSEQGTSQLGYDDRNRIFVMDLDVEQDLAGDSGVIQKNAMPLFTPKKENEIWKLEANETCTVFYHKYAEWCGSNDFVVTSVACNYCESGNCQDLQGLSKRLIGNHVFLIDIRTPASPIYYDLTEKLESGLKMEAGTLFSFTSTCANPVFAE